MTHKKTDEGYPIFRSYLETENDEPYYSMNTLSFYYEDMERKQKLIEDLAKAIAGYDQTLTGNLQAIEQQVAERFEQWDEKLKTFDGSVMDLLQEWVDDGTMDHIVDSSIIDRKLEPITAQLAETDAQKADKEAVTQLANEVSKKADDNVVVKKGFGTLSDFDESTRAVIQGLEPGTINAVLGYKNVQVENIAFIEEGINKVNPLKVKSGIVISISGAETPNASYTSTEPIKVSPSSTYSVRNVYYISSYTAEGVFISRFAVPADQIESYSFVTLPTAEIVVLSTNTSIHPINTVMLNEGEVLPYQKYREPKLSGVGADIAEQSVGSFELADGAVKPEKIASGAISEEKLANKAVSLEKTDFIEKTTNIFNPLSSTKGHTIDLATGILSANGMYDTSDFIKVTPNTSIFLKGFIRVVNFNAAQQRIAGGANFSGSALYDGAPRTLNASTEWIRVAYVNDPTNVSYVEEKQINLGSTLLPYEKYNYKFKETLNLGLNTKQDSVGSKYIFDTDIVGTYNTDRVFPAYDIAAWDAERSSTLYTMFDELMAGNPGYITKEVLTSDLTGNEISAYHFNPKRPAVPVPRKLPKIFITTGTHGYERSTVLNMYYLFKDMCDNWENDTLLEFLRFNVEFIIIPITNPYGWNNFTRGNSNGVDINRQFPVDWNPGVQGTSTWGGTAPLTEIEALNIKSIFDNHKIDVFYDYHNFSGVPGETEDFIWMATSSNKSLEITEALVMKMGRKWKKEFAFIPKDKEVGYGSRMKEGTMHNYANSIGINHTGTFETCTSWYFDQAIKYDQNSLKAGVEAVGNLLLLDLRVLNS